MTTRSIRALLGQPSEDVRVLCIGIATIDQVMTVSALPAGGGKHLASSSYEVGGGVAANAAVAVARLGGDATFAGCFGDDSLGDRARAGLAAEGVDVSPSQRVPCATTPHSVVLIDADGERLVVNHTPTELFARADPDRHGCVHDADVLLTDCRWEAGAVRALKGARELGMPRVVDVDRPLRGTALDILRLASHAIFSRAGLDGTAGELEIVPALERVRELTDAWVAVTDGPNGVWWLEHDAVCHVPAFEITAVDTLGAGDTFHGAFALALGEGADELNAASFASAAAAVKCTRPGGRDGIPTRAQVAAFYDAWVPAPTDVEPDAVLVDALPDRDRALS